MQLPRRNDNATGFGSISTRRRCAKVRVFSYELLSFKKFSKALSNKGVSLALEPSRQTELRMRNFASAALLQIAR